MIADHGIGSLVQKYYQITWKWLQLSFLELKVVASEGYFSLQTKGLCKAQGGNDSIKLLIHADFKRSVNYSVISKRCSY